MNELKIVKKGLNKKKMSLIENKLNLFDEFKNCVSLNVSNCTIKINKSKLFF